MQWMSGREHTRVDLSETAKSGTSMTDLVTLTDKGTEGLARQGNKESATIVASLGIMLRNVALDLVRKDLRQYQLARLTYQ